MRARKTAVKRTWFEIKMAAKSVCLGGVSINSSYYTFELTVLEVIGDRWPGSGRLFRHKSWCKWKRECRPLSGGSDKDDDERNFFGRNDLLGFQSE